MCGAGMFGGPTGRWSQPRALRGTSKPWVWVTTRRLSQGGALKERRRGGERGCAMHGCLSRGTRSPAPIQGATCAQGVWCAWAPGQHSPRLGPPWAESCGPSGRPIRSTWVPVPDIFFSPMGIDTHRRCPPLHWFSLSAGGTITLAGLFKKLILRNG